MRRNLLSAPLLAAAIAAIGLSACQETDPKKPATWIAQLKSDDAKKAVDAARELRKMKAPEAVEPLVAALKHEDRSVRAEAAYALGEIGDKAAVKPLTEAVELKATAKGADLANAKIAEALGTIGDKSATPTIIQMADAPADLVRLEAVKTLGRMQDPSAIPTLIRLTEEEATPPLITKHAIMALGDMKAAESVPALCKAMVLERKGVSFVNEASYALFQIGEPAAKALTGIIDGSDSVFLKWAEEKKRIPMGYLAKSTIVLADMGAREAIPALTKLLSWTADDEGAQLAVRGFAAEALGRMRAKEAAAPIGALVSTQEANIREKFARALAMVGDTSQAGKLESAAKNQKDTWGARMEAANGLALLGDAKSRATLEALAKSETPDAAVKHCLAEESTETDEMKAARCEKERIARPQFLSEALAALKAGDECKADVDCWIGKAKDGSTRVRERAAIALGRSGDQKAVEPLTALARDTELSVRRSAYIAIDWMSQSAAAKEALLSKRDALAKQFEEEKGKAYTVIVNEDLKRVVWKLKQL